MSISISPLFKGKPITTINPELYTTSIRSSFIELGKFQVFELARIVIEQAPPLTIALFSTIS